MENGRHLFHNSEGNFDVSRLLEHAIPLVLMGAVTIYSNSIISGLQIANLKEQMDRSESARVTLQSQLQTTSVELAKLNAQVVAFLAQQVTLNMQMDARITFVERTELQRSIREGPSK
jgi:hypothetical protein